MARRCTSVLQAFPWRRWALAPVALAGLMLLGACAPPTSPYSTFAVDVSGLTGASRISAAPEHGCALASGSVRCWGGAYPPAAGSASPLTVVGVSGAVQISAGANHACAVVTGGTVRCWGLNYDGQLGIGTTSPSSAPADVIGISGATQVAAGETSSCALVTGGAVKCWGSNSAGQLGAGTTDPVSPTPVDVVGVSGATQVVVGDGINGTACALVSGGVRCWGANNVGQLGDGTTADSDVPVPVIGVSGATQVSTGAGTTCALVGGGAKCWGSNQVGQLGNGNQVDSAVPVAVIGLSGAVEISVGGAVTCVRMSGGTVRCWGSNIYGSLGTLTPTYWSGSPVDVFGVAGAVQVTAGGSQACVLLAGGTAKCWGSDFIGELGNG
jgi:alpha-tubulin suppressor-like RCC1 family protein